MKFCSCNLFYARKWYFSRHQKSICDGGIRLSRYFRCYVTLSFLAFPAARSNPQLLWSRLRRALPIATFEKDRHRAELPANELELDRRI